MNRLGFKTGLIAAVVLSLILSLSILSYLSYNLIKEQVEHSLISDLNNIVEKESTNVLNLFGSTEASVASLAELYSKGELPISEIPAAFALSATASGVAKFTLGFDDGSSYVSKPSKSFPGGVGIKSKYDPRTRDWYKVGKQHTGPSISPPFFTSRGDLIMLVMHSVENGVLSADIRFSHLSAELNEVKEQFGMDAFMIADSGLILASTSELVVEKENIFESQDKEFFSRVINDTSAEIKYEYLYNEINTLFLKKAIELSDGSKWYLLLAVEKDIAYAPVQEATMKLLTANIATAVVSVLVLLFIIKIIYSPILSLRQLITGLSQGNGDLTQRLEVKSNDDIGQIAIGINKFIEQLQSMMLEVKKSTEQFTGRVEKIYSQSEENSTVLSRHAVETEQIVAAVEELSSSAMVVADHSASAASSAQEANTNSKNANDVLQIAQDQIHALASEILQASDNVKHMDQKTGDIQSIVEVIGGIAEQTNLLALNASIEAARAGEQGRGFAVVADEVRALANRTQTSTTEIGDAISDLQKEASGVVSSISETKGTCDVTVERAESVSELLQALSEHISGISNMNSEISSSAEEQNKVIQTVSKNITELHAMVEKLSLIANNQYDEVNSIAKINENLGGIIAKFKL